MRGLAQFDSGAARQDRPDVEAAGVLAASGVTVAAEPLLPPRRCARVGGGEGAIGEAVEQDVEFLGEGLSELVEDALGDAGHLRTLAFAHIGRLNRATDINPVTSDAWCVRAR